MLTTPIVEGAYYEREDGSIRKAARFHGHTDRFLLCDGSLGSGDVYWDNGNTWLSGTPGLTRRVYIVPTDPAEVVAELREIAAASHSEIPDGIPEAYNEAADLVAEKLGVGNG